MSRLGEVEEAEDSVFDNLCTTCASLFDESAAWETDEHRSEGYRPHHDIYSLSQAAKANCHLCSMVLGQFLSTEIAGMQYDLDASRVRPSEQVCVKIQWDYYGRLTLLIKTIQPSLDEDFDKEQSRMLQIRYEKDDYSRQNRSTSFTTCSSDTVSQIAHWLGLCVTSHSNCSNMQTIAATRELLPSRLLDLSSVEQQSIVHLTATDGLPRDTKYATLSHCWGGKCETCLTINNLEELKAGVLLDDLPKTFRDAAVVCTRLTVRYLWIDALCIIQDSDEDWRREASLMGDIYANSYFTLAATNSPNSHGGLFTQRSPVSAWPCRVTANWHCLPPGKVVVSSLSSIGGLDQRPLGSRAWAFQEWLLSKRLIHFMQDQVRWQCCSLLASESYPSGLSEQDPEYNKSTKTSIVEFYINHEQRQSQWEQIRIHYGSMHLTNATDGLVAFSGIARMIHKVLGSSQDEYIAGLWKPGLLTELLWRVGRDKVQRRLPGVYIAPSWSWLPSMATPEVSYLRLHPTSAGLL